MYSKVMPVFSLLIRNTSSRKSGFLFLSNLPLYFSPSFLHPSLSPFLSPLLPPFPTFLYLPFSLPSPLPTSLPPLLPLFSRKELGSLRLKVQCHEERVLDSQLYTKFVGIMLKTVEGEPSVRLNKQPLTPYSASLSLMLTQISLPQF